MARKTSRKGPDWLDLGLQFAGFVAIFLMLSAVNWPFVLKLVLGFGLAILLGIVMRFVRIAIHKRRMASRTEPKRIRVVNVETVPDNKPEKSEKPRR